jgi:regulator of sigma E protease
MIPFGPQPIPEQRLFESKSLPARLLILFAGVTMNVVLAFVIGIGLALHFGRAVTPSHVVGQVRALPNAPTLSELHPGDTLVAVNGHPVHTWQDVLREIGLSRDSVAFRTTQRTIAVPVGSPGAPTIDDLITAIDVQRHAVLDTVVDTARAYAAGLRSKDTVVAIDGKPIHTWDQLVAIVTKSPEQHLMFSVRRQGKTLTFDVVPKATLDTVPFTQEVRTVGKIGAGPPSETLQVPVGFGAAISAGAKTTWIMGGAIVHIVKDLVTRRLSVRQLSGPVGITRMSVEAARSGLESLFTLIALLSVNVAILNLLPIPVLDGGQILINVLESVKGRPFSLRTREYILRFGLLAIALLFVVVMYNDTRGWFVRLADWVTKLRG